MSRYYLSEEARSFSEQFYDWEMRLRGYDVWPYPVSPEPPFYSLFDDYKEPAPVTDDARRETFLSRFAGLFRRKTQERGAQYYDVKRDVAAHTQEYPLWLPEMDIPESDLVFYHVILPPGVEYAGERCQQFLMSLRALRQPLSFECIGMPTYIALQWVCRETDSQMFGSQLAAFFPDAVITAGGDLLARGDLAQYSSVSMVDFGLRHEVHTPLPEHVERYDPFVSVVAALSGCRSGECAALQVLFTPCRNPWSHELRESVTDDDGTSLFSDAQEFVPSVRAKTSSPLFGAIVRAVGAAQDGESAHRHVQALGSALIPPDQEHKNELIPLKNEGYPPDIHLYDITQRMTHRGGMLLSAQELTSLVHLPRKDVVHKKLLVAGEHTRERPRIVSSETECSLGINRHHGIAHGVYVSVEQRLRHTYVVGASGTGKSTLLLHLLCADAQAGHGIALLDPHGDLSDDFLARVPEHRRDDVILIDPSDDEFPIGLNILHAHTDAERTLIASDLPRLFERLSSHWGDQMHAVLANGILAMLAHSEGGTLLTLRRFLLEGRFRATFLEGVNDREVVYYWKNVFPSLSGKPYAPVLTRLDTFLRSEVIRNMVGQPASSINYDEILEQKKILIVKLSHGAIGEENAALLGTLAITAIHQAALRRERLAKKQRDPFFLYIDEFQNFVTPTMEGLLSGARKYGVGLILAHQELRQLASRDRDVASSVLSNPYTRICFRLGDQDAATLAKGFSSFNAEDLQSLGIGRAIVRVEQAQYDFSLETLHETDKAFDHSEYIKERSRRLYAQSRDAVARGLSVFYEDALKAEDKEEKAAQKTQRKQSAGPVPRATAEPASAKDETEERSPIDDRVKPDPPVEKKKQAREKAVVEKTPGGGGANHKYLQSLIQKLGQERGFRAEIEHKVTGGFIDVVLFGKKTKIACEVNVANATSYEVGNIQKCLDAGFDHVVLIAQNKRKVGSISKVLDEAMSDAERKKVELLLPEAFLSFIDDKGAREASSEKTVRGYKVKVNYAATDEKQQKVKRDAIARLMVESMKRGNM